MTKKIITYLGLVASDFLCILLCFFLAFSIRRDILPFLYPSLLERPAFFSIYLNKFYMFSVWIGVFFYEKLYTKRYSFWDETRLFLKSSTISFALIMISVFLIRQYQQYSRLIILLAWLLSLAMLPLFRYLTKRLLIMLNLWKKKVIIIGTIASSASLIETIGQNKNLGYQIVGCLTADRSKIGESVSGVKILGHVDEISQWKEKTGFEDIIVTLPDIQKDKLISLLKKWEQISDTIRYIPRTGDLISTGVEIENIGKILSLTVRKNLHKPWNLLAKWVFEYLVAFLSFFLCLPLFLAISLAIKIDSHGPVFYIQERFGRRGKKINLIKFRSMYADAQRRLENHIKKNPLAREEWLKFKKLKAFDPRVTRVGKFLRKYSLDELPQLINVLTGEMSLVGPRPYIAEELKEVEVTKSLLFQVKPGITGLWQTSGRSLITFQDRLSIDEYYVRNWSFWLDSIILIKTINVALSAKGAF